MQKSTNVNAPIAVARLTPTFCIQEHLFSRWSLVQCTTSGGQCSATPLVALVGPSACSSTQFRRKQLRRVPSVSLAVPLDIRVLVSVSPSYLLFTHHLLSTISSCISDWSTRRTRSCAKVRGTCTANEEYARYGGLSDSSRCATAFCSLQQLSEPTPPNNEAELDHLRGLQSVHPPAPFHSTHFVCCHLAQYSHRSTHTRAVGGDSLRAGVSAGLAAQGSTQPLIDS